MSGGLLLSWAPGGTSWEMSGGESSMAGGGRGRVLGGGEVGEQTRRCCNVSVAAMSNTTVDSNKSLVMYMQDELTYRPDFALPRVLP